MRRILFLFCSLVLASAAVFALQPTFAANAQSTGCGIVNGSSNVTFGPQPFEAGEIITYTFTFSTTSTLWSVSASITEAKLGFVASNLVIPNGNSASAKATYTIPKTGTYDFTFLGVSAYLAGGTTSFTHYSTCTPKPAVATPSTEYVGPAIPSGFVLKTIACNTAVFDSAGGNPVPGAVITAGQTWFVNPTPVNDGKGKSWTEIFVSGTPNGFVWSSCVK